MTSPKMRRTFGAFALAGGLALAAGACGSSSSSKKTTTPAKKGSSTPAAPAANQDMVTAISHLTGQGTTVTLNAGTAKALTGLGVKVAPVGKATASDGGDAITFPITSGYAEIHSDHSYQPGYVIGSIEHSGGISFTKGAKTLSVTDFTVDPGNSMLYASVDNSQTTPQIPLAYLDGSALQISEPGGDVVLNGTVAELTATAAKALDSEFGTTEITAGLPIGTVHLVATGQTTTYNEATDKTTDVTRLTGNNTGVTLDPATAKVLTQTLGLKLGTYGAATFDTTNSELHFPITGGVAIIHSNKSAQPGYIDGVLLHQDSGFTLSKGGTTVTISDLTIDPGNSTLTGTVNGEQGVDLANLDGSSVAVSMVGDTVHLDGTKVLLTATATQALNKAFGTTAIPAGVDLGTAHIVVDATAPPMGSVNS